MVAKAFAREGARVFLSGGNAAPVEAVTNDIMAVGGVAETTTLHALDERAIERHVAEVAGKSGGIDVRVNAIAFRAVQGVPLSDLAPKDFANPMATWTTSQFLTPRAAARHMLKNRFGVILTLSASPARVAIAMTGGFGMV